MPEESGNWTGDGEPLEKEREGRGTSTRHMSFGNGALIDGEKRENKNTEKKKGECAFGPSGQAHSTQGGGKGCQKGSSFSTREINIRLLVLDRDGPVRGQRLGMWELRPTKHLLRNTFDAALIVALFHPGSFEENFFCAKASVCIAHAGVRGFGTLEFLPKESALNWSPRPPIAHAPRRVI